MRIVKLDGKAIPESQLPAGSLYIQGKGWYSSVNTVPKNLQVTYKTLFALQEKAMAQYLKDATSTPVPVKSTKKCTVC
jgi:hypothetical protein